MLSVAFVASVALAVVCVSFVVACVAFVVLSVALVSSVVGSGETIFALVPPTETSSVFL